jgi:hypothetical protein
MQNLTIIDLEHELTRWRALAIAALLVAVLFCGLLLGRWGAGRAADRNVTYRLQVELPMKRVSE